jgi:hypothetical protein
MRKEDKSTEIYGAATGQHTIVHVREREKKKLGLSAIEHASGCAETG